LVEPIEADLEFLTLEDLSTRQRYSALRAAPKQYEGFI